MVDFDACVRAAAAGLIKAWNYADTYNLPLQEIHSEPIELRRARSMLSLWALEQHVSAGLYEKEAFLDLTSSMHEAIALFRKPTCEWPGPYRNEDHPLAYDAFIDEEFNRISPFVYDLLHETGRNSEENESALFKKLHDCIGGVKSVQEGDRLYSKARHFVVSGGVRHKDELFDFGAAHGPLYPFITDAYEPVDRAYHITTEKLHRCSRCKTLIKPVVEQGQVRFACSSVDCRALGATDQETLEGNISDWMQLKTDLIVHWLRHGLDEVELYNCLSRGSYKWVLYPHRDEVDVGLNDRSIGIDLKCYSSPIWLGQTIARTASSDALRRWKMPIIAVPDRFCKSQKQYMEILEEEFNIRRVDAWTPRFMKVSDVVKEFGK